MFELVNYIYRHRGFGVLPEFCGECKNLQFGQCTNIPAPREPNFVCQDGHEEPDCSTTTLIWDLSQLNADLTLYPSLESGRICLFMTVVECPISCNTPNTTRFYADIG